MRAAALRAASSAPARVPFSGCDVNSCMSLQFNVFVMSNKILLHISTAPGKLRFLLMTFDKQAGKVNSASYLSTFIKRIYDDGLHCNG